ncbi:MAG: tetratricopeptide repeat protein [Terriglobia bacterium]
MRDARLLAGTLTVLLLPLSSRPAELPALPKLNMADFLPAIRRQVQQADAAARANPRSADASGNMGMVLDAYQQYESAAFCYRRARELNPRAFRWAYYLGADQLHQGAYDQAAASLREALALSPDYLPARLKLAESLLAGGNLDESGKIYEAILKDVAKKPRDGDKAATAEALYGMGRIESARGDISAAAESYRKACELFPDYGAAHYALALAYSKLGKPDMAQPHFSVYQANMTVTPPIEDPLLAAVQALNLGADPHLRRAIEMEKQGKLDEAIEEQDQALAVDPKSVQARINLISLYGRTGQTEKAEQNFQEAVRLNPNRADAYYDEGVLLMMQNKFPEAEQAFRQALRINPFYAEAHNNLGVLLERKGRTEDAMAEYEAALQSQPDYRVAHYHEATILARRGKYDEAIAQLLPTLTPQDESTPVYLYALAIAYGRKGDRENALKYMHMARDEAAARNQAQLLASIDRDLRSLEQAK